MSEFRDPAFKLFGRTIPMPPYQETPVAKSVDSLEEELSQFHPIKPQSDQKNEESEEEEQVSSAEPTTNSSGLNESSKTDPSNKETPMNATKSLKREDKENEWNNSEEKTVKKPDKVLPCPRCNSLDTKFCYYNNYNVNQPRHFCKNCQRYWTAGGTMRNVPVGAGRRKNKHSTSQHYRQISVSEDLPMVHPDAPDSILCHHPFKPKGSVLSFGSDAPLCKPMASVLNLADKNIAKRNGFHVSEDMKPPVGENGEEHSNASSVTASNLTEERKQGNLQEPLTGNYSGFPPPVPCFPGTPWPPYAAQWSSTPPAFCPSNYPVSFYPAGYWGCAIPAGWSIPWIETGQGLSSSPSRLPITGSNPGSNSPLGKHTRDGNKLNQFTSVKGNTAEERNTENCLWIPKTLRIDDPDEARRSSIWATLGIKNDKAELISGGGMFKAFQSKTEKTTPMSDAAQVLMNANPAALSRSINFHENL